MKPNPKPTDVPKTYRDLSKAGGFVLPVPSARSWKRVQARLKRRKGIRTYGRE